MFLFALVEEQEVEHIITAATPQQDTQEEAVAAEGLFLCIIMEFQHLNTMFL
jgi:hypothetical protein